MAQFDSEALVVVGSIEYQGEHVYTPSRRFRGGDAGDRACTVVSEMWGNSSNCSYTLQQPEAAFIRDLAAAFRIRQFHRPHMPYAET